VTLDVEATPEVKGHFGGYVIGICATGEINREAFGMNWNQALEAGGVLVGKEIHFQIDVELNRPE
jgi:polyisoprenoid-binding protein YceI